VLVEEPDSVVSGKSVEAPSRRPTPAGRKAPAARSPAPSPRRCREVAPQLAATAERRRGQGLDPRDQVRRLPHPGVLRGGKVRLITRNGHDWTHRYGALAKAFEKLPCKSAILDGEVVVQDARGVTRSNLLEQALSRATRTR
jgi:hypothetical protein